MKKFKGHIANMIIVLSPMWLWKRLPIRIRVWAFLNDLEG